MGEKQNVPTQNVPIVQAETGWSLLSETKKRLTFNRSSQFPMAHEALVEHVLQDLEKDAGLRSVQERQVFVRSGTE